MIKNKNIKNLIFFITFTLIIFISKIGKTQELSLFKDLGLYGGQITCIAFDPNDAKIMYAGSWMGDGVFKSENGGATWFTIPQNNPSWFRNEDVNDIEIDPNDTDTMWVAYEHYVAVSHDAGTTWETFYFASDEDRFCYSVTVDPFDSFNAPARPGGIYISTNGGQSWRSVISGLPRYFAVSDLKIADDFVGTVYAALYTGYSDTENNLGGIYVSLNGGTYWTRTGLSDYVTYDVNIESPDAGNLSPRAKTALTAAGYTPTYTVYAGTASGLLTEDQSTIAGMGIVSGMITSTFDNARIGNAYVSSTAGTGAQSDQGFYLMLVPSGQHNIQASALGYLQISASSVYVNAGGSTELNITMMPTDNSTPVCISEQLLQRTADSNQLQSLLALRDNILKKTALGKTIISRYYSLGKDVLPVLLGNAHLKTHCLKLLGSSAEIARTAASSKNFSLPPGFMDTASSFLFALEKASPAELQKKFGNFAVICGISMSTDFNHVSKWLKAPEPAHG